MVSDEEVRAVADRLAPLGFTMTAGGRYPMGDGLWRFSTENIDIELYSDRGNPLVSAGAKGSNTFGPEVWFQILGIEPMEISGYQAVLEFLLTNLNRIEYFLTNEPNAEERLRDANRTRVMKRLHLPPGTLRHNTEGDNP